MPGQLTEIHASAADKFLQKGTQWFTVDYSYAARVLQDVMTNYKNYLKLSRKQTQYVKDNFSRDKMDEQFVSIIDKCLQQVPQQVGLKLPKLNKTKSEAPKLKLPKLKKVNV